MAVVAAPVSGRPVRGGAAARLACAALLTAILALLTACSLGGAGGEAALAVAIDETSPDKPILTPAPDVVQPDREYFIRLEVPAPLDAEYVRVRLEKRVGGSHQQRGEFLHPVIAPWTVVVIPISVPDSGEWNIALIVNSRKVTDVRFHAKRS